MIRSIFVCLKDIPTESQGSVEVFLDKLKRKEYSLIDLNMKDEEDLYSVIFTYMQKHSLLPTETIAICSEDKDVDAIHRLAMHCVHVRNYDLIEDQTNILLELYEDDGRLMYCCE